MTSIQKFLGHKRIDTTMIYAQVHDQSVSDDYYAAMNRIEIRLDLAVEDNTGSASMDISTAERTRLLDIASRLSEPHLDTELRLKMVAQMRFILNGTTPASCAAQETTLIQ